MQRARSIFSLATSQSIQSLDPCFSPRMRNRQCREQKMQSRWKTKCKLERRRRSLTCFLHARALCVCFFPRSSALAKQIKLGQDIRCECEIAFFSHQRMPAAYGAWKRCLNHFKLRWVRQTHIARSLKLWAQPQCNARTSSAWRSAWMNRASRASTHRS